MTRSASSTARYSSSCCAAEPYTLYVRTQIKKVRSGQQPGVSLGSLRFAGPQHPLVRHQTLRTKSSHSWLIRRTLVSIPCPHGSQSSRQAQQHVALQWESRISFRPPTFSRLSLTLPTAN
jgi:hypothetical protein